MVGFLSALPLLAQQRQHVIWATAGGDDRPDLLTASAFARDDFFGPNATDATGDWTTRLQAAHGGFTLAGRTESIVTVEAVLSVSIGQALTDDTVRVQAWLNDPAQGSEVVVPTATLNTRIGSANKGIVTADLTSQRAWSWSDFDGDLELAVRQAAIGAADAPTTPTPPRPTWMVSGSATPATETSMETAFSTASTARPPMPASGRCPPPPPMSGSPAA